MTAAATPPGARPALAPVFIVGACRSGTTLLRLMLNEHPDLAIPSESHFLIPLLRAHGPTAVLSGPALCSAISTVTAAEQWQHDFAHTPDELVDRIGDQPIGVAEFIDRVFRLEVGDQPARWGDKTPVYLHIVDLLLTCFPDAQVIGIVRDPRDVFASLRALGWFGTTTWDIGRYLAMNGRFLQRWTERYPPQRFRVVRYEDLVVDTERTLRELCDGLQLPFAGEMQAFFRNTNRNVPSRELGGHHAKLLRPPDVGDVGRWRREGSSLHHAEIEALTVEVVDAYGYERRVGDLAVALLRLEARARHHVRAPRAVAARTATQLARRVRGLAGRSVRS